MTSSRSALSSVSSLRFFPRALLSALALAAAPAAMRAATITWTGQVSSNWSDRINWTDGTNQVAPTTGDDVVLVAGAHAPSNYDMGSANGGVNPQFKSVTLSTSVASYNIAPVGGSDRITLQAGGTLTDTSRPASPSTAPPRSPCRRARLRRSPSPAARSRAQAT